MKHFRTTITIFVIVFLLGIVTSSWGALTESGSISFNNGLYASGDNWNNLATTLTWNVSQQTNGTYKYDYTFALSSDPHTRAISHIITQVSPNFTDADMLTGTTSGGIIGTYDGQGNSNSGLPASLYGIKWDTSVNPVTTFSWTIVTDRAPTLGNFFARDGSNVYAVSGTYDVTTGLAVFGNNVVVPDTVTPIPAAAWLLGSGLVGLIGIRRKNV